MAEIERLLRSLKDGFYQTFYNLGYVINYSDPSQFYYSGDPGFQSKEHSETGSSISDILFLTHRVNSIPASIDGSENISVYQKNKISNTMEMSSNGENISNLVTLENDKMKLTSSTSSRENIRNKDLNKIHYSIRRSNSKRQIDEISDYEHIENISEKGSKVPSREKYKTGKKFQITKDDSLDEYEIIDFTPDCMILLDDNKVNDEDFDYEQISKSQVYLKDKGEEKSIHENFRKDKLQKNINDQKPNSKVITVSKPEPSTISHSHSTKLGPPSDQPSSIIILSTPTNIRKMWSEMPEVIESGVLVNSSKKEIQLQEAMFEIITSEASYFQSLRILVTHFLQADLFSMCDDKDSIVSLIEKHHIFSNITLIFKASQNFLDDLEQRWKDQNPILSDVCDIVLTHTNNEDFLSYITYMRNQQYQTEALKRLSENEIFKQQLHILEASPISGKLTLDSYLMLPMQRLTRLKLLVEAVSKIQNSGEMEDKVQMSVKKNATDTMEQIKKLLNTSNTEKGFMDQKAALLFLINKIDFPPNCKTITLSGRELVLEDEVQVHNQTSMKTIKKFSKKKQPFVTLLLFKDLLMIVKKKNERLLVLDYCDKENVKVAVNFPKNDHSKENFGSDLKLENKSFDTRSILSSIGSSEINQHPLSSPNEKKQFLASLNNSFSSLTGINKIVDDQIGDQNFIIQLLTSNTGLLDSPLVITAQNRNDRDLWLSLFDNDQFQNGCFDSSSNQNTAKLLKSKSMRTIPTHAKSTSLKKHYSFRNWKNE